MKLSNHFIGLYFIGIILILFSCTITTTSQGESAPLPVESQDIDIQDLDIATGQTIFVPAYSEIYFASNNRTLDLAVTLSIHNADFTNPIIITSVRYYNTQGSLVREYAPQSQRLDALATATFFVDAGEETGGVGTNFVVEWVAEQPVYEPVVEALMINTSGSQGLSFTSPGRVINQINKEQQ